MTLDRRTALTAAAATVAVAATPAVAEPPALDLSTPAGRLRAYMQMRGALDRRLVIGFISGTYYGVVEDEITPLYGVIGATFARYRPNADGGYDAATYETPFFTDLQTGAVLEQWRNPYTGEVVTPSHVGFPASALTIRADLKIVSPDIAGMVAESGVVSTLRSGADVWITERTTSAIAPPGVAKPSRYSEVIQLHARGSDFTLGAARVPCQTAYTSVVSWRPWLKMGDRPGHLLGTGAGAYGVELAALPENLTRALQARRPNVLTHPAAPLDSLLHSGA